MFSKLCSCNVHCVPAFIHTSCYGTVHFCFLFAIPVGCFYKCFALMDLSIPKLVRAIRAGSFSNCINLRSMDLSKNTNLEEVGREAFGHCSLLTSIVLRSSASNIQFGETISSTVVPRYPPSRCIRGIFLRFSPQ